MFRALLLSFIRLCEANIYKYLKNSIFQLFLKKKYGSSEVIDQMNLKKRELEEDPQIVFLSSNLNNILVCTILQGINQSID